MLNLARMIVIAAIALGACVESQALVVKWTLNNVMFNDGGTAKGYFLVDTATGQLKLTRPPGDYFEEGTRIAGFEIITEPGPGGDFPGHGFIPRLYGNGYEAYELGGNALYAAAGRTGYAFSLVLNFDADISHRTRGTFAVLPGSDPCYSAFGRCSSESWYISDDTGGGPTYFRTVAPGGTLTVSMIPEPSTLALLGLGLGALAIARRRESGGDV